MEKVFESQKVMIGGLFLIELFFSVLEICSKAIIFAGVYYLFGGKGEFLVVFSAFVLLTSVIVFLRLIYEKVVSESH